VLLAGASGLAGGYALDALLEAPEIRRVLAVSRRSLGREHPRLANASRIEHLEAQIKGASCELRSAVLHDIRRPARSRLSRGRRRLRAGVRARRKSGERPASSSYRAWARTRARNFYLRTRARWSSGWWKRLRVARHPAAVTAARWRGEAPAGARGPRFYPAGESLLRGRYIPYRAIPRVPWRAMLAPFAPADAACSVHV